MDLSSKHLDEIIELITKEEYLENEVKIEKALAKSIEERQQQQQQQQKQQLKTASTDDSQKSIEEMVKKSEDEKHILQTPEQFEASDKDGKVRSYLHVFSAIVRIIYIMVFIPFIIYRCSGR